MLGCLRELTYLAAVYEFEIHARHIEGVNNRLPDSQSRWYTKYSCRKEFHVLAKAIKITQVQVKASMFKFMHTW